MAKTFLEEISAIDAAALQYFLCCYRVRHEVPCALRTPLALSAVLVTKLKRIKTRAAIEAATREEKVCGPCVAFPQGIENRQRDH